jgi:hypothetical protein
MGNRKAGTTRPSRTHAAVQRQEAYAKMPIVDRIKRLNEKFGEGVGAKKERARYEKMISDLADDLAGVES